MFNVNTSIIEAAIDDSGICEFGETEAVVIDRAFPHFNNETCGALKFARPEDALRFMVALALQQPEEAAIMADAANFEADGVVYFPQVQFMGPLCKYDEKSE